MRRIGWAIRQASCTWSVHFVITFTLISFGLIGGWSVWDNSNCRPLRWWVEDGCRSGFLWDKHRYEHDSWAVYRKWVFENGHFSYHATPKSGGWPIVNHQPCEPIADAECLSHPLVVIATTLSDSRNNERRQQAQTLALNSWRQLSPSVCVLANVDNTTSSQHLESQGILTTTCDKNPSGLPYFGDLLRGAENVAKQQNSAWAGYVNGDIGFDHDLIESLKYLNQQSVAGVLGPKMVVIGQRCNIRILDVDKQQGTPINGHSGGGGGGIHTTLCKSNESSWPRNLDFSTAELHDSSAEDFFFFTPGSIPWEDFPSFVVARPGFDNLFVQWIINQGVAVIDATKGFTALHFVTGGAHDGWKPKQDLYWNFCALLHTATSTVGPWQAFGDQCKHCVYGFVNQAHWKLEVSHKRFILRNQGTRAQCRDPRRFTTQLT